jgi:hypothetical protein
LKYRVGVTGRIGVYGRSIGSTAACRLCPYADVVIADRGLSDLMSFVEVRYNDGIGKEVVKVATGGW